MVMALSATNPANTAIRLFREVSKYSLRRNGPGKTHAIEKKGSFHLFFGLNLVPVFSFPSLTAYCPPLGAVLLNP
jgi:hypothetical protein